MDDHQNNNEENILKFGISIYKITSQGKSRLEIKMKNSGIPDAEVILILDAILKRAKTDFEMGIIGTQQN